MNFVLDTNVVSELRKPPSRIDPAVARWVSSQQDFALHLPAMVVYELEIGVRRVERRDAAQGRSLRRWLDTVQESFAGRVLPFDEAAARRAAALQIPDPRSDHDCFIAATATVHGMTVVTRNVKDFSSFGVPVINPWTG